MLNMFCCGFAPRVHSFNKNQETQTIETHSGSTLDQENIPSFQFQNSNENFKIQSQSEPKNILKELPSDILRRISEIVVREDPRALYNLELAYPPIRKSIDKRIRYISGVSQNGTALRKLSVEYRKDKEIVLAAVRNTGLALRYAVEYFSDDKEVVLAAIRQNPMTLRYASHRLRDDADVVRTALEIDMRALQYASERFRGIIVTL